MDVAREESIATQGYEFHSEFARKHAEEGRKEGEQKMLLKQLGLKFGELPDQVMQRIRAASEMEIERWAARLWTAQTLDEVFAD